MPGKGLEEGLLVASEVCILTWVLDTRVCSFCECAASSLHL